MPTAKAMGSQITFDRYGRQQFALRATYSVTPDLDLRGLVSPGWTARAVDTDGQTGFVNFGSAAGPIQCATNSSGKGAGCNGDATYIGTEVSLGLTWRFAPGLSLALAGSVLFSGSALDSSEIRNGVLTHMDAKNIYTVVSRLRYSF